MTPAAAAMLLMLAIGLLSLLAALSAFVQTLYLEAMRFRPREVPALEFFKDHLEDRIGLKLERGALSFSLIKYTAVLLVGLCYLEMLNLNGREPIAGFLEAAVASWLLLTVTSYLAPQLVYRRSSARWLAPIAGLIQAMALIVRPVIYLLEFLQDLAELTDTKNGDEEKNGHATEEIDALIAAGEEEGILEQEERKLIESVVAFGDKTAREAMTPRPKIVAISAEKTLLDLRELVAQAQHSRIPVYRQSIDNIEGFIRARDLFKIRFDQLAAKKVSELMRPIRFVPETKRIAELMREFQEESGQVAVVVDEYGNTAGLVTLEDLVEEIFGEIRDEHEAEHDITEMPDGSYLIHGNVDLDRLDEILAFRPSEDYESTTVGGLVTEWLGRLPEQGEVIEKDGLRIEVVESDDRKVEQVRISPLEVAQEA